jgi:hypothetical protein
MSHAEGKKLDSMHDLPHMIQKIFIANYNYQPEETTVAAKVLISLLVPAAYAVRKNSSLKCLHKRARSKVCYVLSNNLHNGCTRPRSKYFSSQRLAHS